MNGIIKAVTPPIFRSVLRRYRAKPATGLFEGDHSMYESLARTAKVYGEYGCGSSTKWILNNTDAKLFSIDSDERWINEVRKSVDEKALARASFYHVDLGVLGPWGRPLSYEKRDAFSAYTDWLWAHDSKPDTVLIDGRFRVCSFLTSIAHAAEGTRIIFDDYTNRPGYQIIERYVRREDVCGRQCLFIVPKESAIDRDALQEEIRNFRHVTD